VDVADELAGAGAAGGGLIGRVGGRDGGDGGLVVEAVEITAGVLELADPAVWLRSSARACFFSVYCDVGNRAGWARRRPIVVTEARSTRPTGSAHLHDHHVAVKGARPARALGTRDMRADLGDDGGAKGHVGHKVAIHDVDVQPVGALVHLARALAAQAREVGAEDGGGDNGVGSHAGSSARLAEHRSRWRWREREREMEKRPERGGVEAAIPAIRVRAGM